MSEETKILPTNAQFAKTVLVPLCTKLELDPKIATTRQASKYRHKKGTLYTKSKELHNLQELRIALDEIKT
jgi:hypothetical protein